MFCAVQKPYLLILANLQSNKRLKKETLRFSLRFFAYTHLSKREITNHLSNCNYNNNGYCNSKRARAISVISSHWERISISNNKPLYVLSHDLGGAENLVKRKDSKLKGQSHNTFINMLADSQHTCVWVSNLLFMNCHSISQDIPRFSYIIMSTSCTCYYV